jgi:hypothetical protein
VYFTAERQREVLARDLAAQRRGAMLPLAILGADGEIWGAHAGKWHDRILFQLLHKD